MQSNANHSLNQLVLNILKPFDQNAAFNAVTTKYQIEHGHQLNTDESTAIDAFFDELLNGLGGQLQVFDDGDYWRHEYDDQLYTIGEIVNALKLRIHRAKSATE